MYISPAINTLFSELFILYPLIKISMERMAKLGFLESAKKV